MVGETDRNDKKETRSILIVLIILTLVLVGATLMLLPLVTELMADHFAPGLGMKDAAVFAFFTTIVVLLAFALGAGDGLLGEIQFVLPAFFAFFITIWLLIAWIF